MNEWMNLDFVLVYEEANDDSEKSEDDERNEKWRQQFMANLLKAGVEQEEVAITSGCLSAKSLFHESCACVVISG